MNEFLNWDDVEGFYDYYGTLYWTNPKDEGGLEMSVCDSSNHGYIGSVILNEFGDPTFVGHPKMSGMDQRIALADWKAENL